MAPVYYHQIQKVVKKSARREQLQREEAEQRRLKTVLELQFLLDRLGDDTVRQDLKQGLGGSPLLTDADLTAFDEFYKLVGPDRDQNVRLVDWINFKMKRTSVFFNKGIDLTYYFNTCRLVDQYEEASVHLWDLLEGKDKAVVGTTCKLYVTLSLKMVSSSRAQYSSGLGLDWANYFQCKLQFTAATISRINQFK